VAAGNHYHAEFNQVHPTDVPVQNWTSPQLQATMIEHRHVEKIGQKNRDMARGVVPAPTTDTDLNEESQRITIEHPQGDGEFIYNLPMPVTAAYGTLEHEKHTNATFNTFGAQMANTDPDVSRLNFPDFKPEDAFGHDHTKVGLGESMLYRAMRQGFNDRKANGSFDSKAAFNESVRAVGLTPTEYNKQYGKVEFTQENRQIMDAVGVQLAEFMSNYAVGYGDTRQAAYRKALRGFTELGFKGDHSWTQMSSMLQTLTPEKVNQFRPEAIQLSDYQFGPLSVLRRENASYIPSFDERRLPRASLTDFDTYVRTKKPTLRNINLNAQNYHEINFIKSSFAWAMILGSAFPF